MTLASEGLVGADLDHGNAEGLDSLGVERALDVALENRHAHAIEVAEHGLEQGRLAGPRRAHQVDHLHGRSIEILAIRSGDGRVRVEYSLMNRHWMMHF